MSAWIDEQRHAVFVGAASGVAWRELPPQALALLLAQERPYNVRPARVGEELVFLASFASGLGLAEVRQAWLAEEVTEAAARVRDGRRIARKPPPVAGPCGSSLLERLRTLACATRWGVCGDAVLELRPEGDGEDARIQAELGAEGLALGAGRTWPEARSVGAESALALALAALGLNARFVAARLRLPDPQGLPFRVECTLPAHELGDDELEFALEGVRHAAREARSVLAPLIHRTIAREYMTALELGREPEGGNP